MTPDPDTADARMLAAVVDTVMRIALAPVVTRLRALEIVLADVPAVSARIAAGEPCSYAAVERQLDQQLAVLVAAVRTDG